MNNRLLNCHWAFQREALQFCFFFHCCEEQIYLFISQLLFSLERKKKKGKKINLGFESNRGERKFLFLYLYIMYIYTYTLSTHTLKEEWKWNARQRQLPLETVVFSLLQNPIVRVPQLLQVDSLTVFTLAASFPTKHDNKTKEAAFIRLLLVCCASHICAF